MIKDSIEEYQLEESNNIRKNIVPTFLASANNNTITGIRLKQFQNFFFFSKIYQNK